MTAGATYVYCIVSSTQPIQTKTVPAGPPGTGAVRALEIRPGRYLIVSDASLAEYGEASLSTKLSDLEWVSRAAVAHEAVTQSFMMSSPPADAVVPMKLFTLFTSDQRAIEEIGSGWKRIEALIRRLNKHEEWGVRLVFDPSTRPDRSRGARSGQAPAPSPGSGREYLAAKRRQNAALAQEASAVRKTAAGVLKTLRPLARDVRQRAVTTPPESRSRLLFDAAFLVPRAKGARFQKSVETSAKKIAPAGYALQLSGPWPPYSFVDKA